MSTLSKDEMDFEKIEGLLRSTHFEPGKNFHQRMSEMPWNKRTRFSLRTKTYLAPVIVTLVLVMIAGLFLVTPTGNAIARQVMQFFARSEGNILPVPTEYITELLPTHTPAPPYGLALVPVGMDDFINQLPTPPAPQGISLDEAESLAGFDLFEPSRLPRDYALSKVEFNNENQTVRLEFNSPQAGSGEFFAITQGMGLEPIEVGASAGVEDLQIGNSFAQLVQGGWFTSLGSTEATWSGDGGPVYLRWEAKGITIEMLFMLNDTFFPAYITRDEMIELAEALVQCPSTNSEVCDGDHAIVSRLSIPGNDNDWMDAYRSVAEVKTLSEFDVLIPGLLPQGISFSHVRFNTNLKMVWIEFGDFSSDLMHIDGPHLRISQKVLSAENEALVENYPPEAIKTVSINGYDGKLYQGSLEWPQAAAGRPTPAPIWESDTGSVMVTWSTETIRYSISFDPGSLGGERLSPQNLLLIAESLE